MPVHNIYVIENQHFQSIVKSNPLVDLEKIDKFRISLVFFNITLTYLSNELFPRFDIKSNFFQFTYFSLQKIYSGALKYLNFELK